MQANIPYVFNRSIRWLMVSIIFLTPLPHAAAGSLFDSIEPPLTDALNAIRMQSSDLTLRWDYTKDDPFRLQLIKDIFGQPLSAVDETNRLVRDFDRAVDDPDSLFAHAAHVLDLDWTFPDYETQPDLATALALLGADDPNSKVPDAIAPDLLEWLSALIAARQLSRGAFAAISGDDFNLLQEKARTLLLQDPDAEEQSLADMRAAELQAIAEQKAFIDVAARFDRLKMLQAAYLLKKTEPLLLKIAVELQLNPLSKPLSIATAAGHIVLGTPAADTYANANLLIVDPGGDDFYGADSLDFEPGRIRIVVDQAGNDTYRTLDGGQGSGVFGVGLHLDLAGDDIYTARHYGQGCGLFGVGLLYDKAGNDVYSGDTGVQAAGAFGLGLLVDREGSDLYQAQLLSQGMGYCLGLGLLLDQAGYDRYLAQSTYADILRNENHTETLSQGFGMGMRPYGSGGIGLLYDRAGNDLYFADVFGQGSSYWFALGGLVDDAGDDVYSGFDYVQGSGVHLALGVCLDKAGNDNYRAWGVSQGCGHDLALGALLDLKGEDNYVCRGLSQGGGNANGFSVFVDFEGRDGYIAKDHNTMGYSDTRRTFGMAGIFLDLGGNDFYGSVWGENDTFWTHSTYGAGFDTDFMQPEEATAEAKTDTFPEPLGSDVRTLFLQASASPAKYQPMVQPARDSLIAMGVDSLSYLLTKLNTEHPREYHALRMIIPKIGPAVIPILADSLHASDRRTVSNTIWFMGLVGDSTAAPYLAEFLHHERWGVRMMTAEAMGRSRHPAYETDLLPLLADSLAHVRQRAAWALGQFGSERSVTPLLDALSDTNQIVRHSAENALSNLGLSPALQIENRLKTAAFPANAHLIRLLGRLDQADEPAHLQQIHDFLNHDDWRLRAAAVEALSYLTPDKVVAILQQAMRTEKHPRVKTAIQMTLDRKPE